jgi:AcrR family transcriptional regulator
MFKNKREFGMLDFTTDKGRYISAALTLAAERPWADVTLADIAARAGLPLAGIKTHFSGKSDIVVAFAGMVDDEVLSRAPRREDGQAARDALFEVLMSRFDVLEPWKAAVRSIAGRGLPDPGQALAVLTSNRWMLEAAGVGSGGLDGAVRTAGLATVYAAVFRIWLDDDDPGLARTMAALDRRLRRGERTLEGAESICKGVRGFANSIFGAAEGIRSRMDEARRGRPASDAGDDPVGQPGTSGPPPI